MSRGRPPTWPRPGGPGSARPALRSGPARCEAASRRSEPPGPGEQEGAGVARDHVARMDAIEVLRVGDVDDVEAQLQRGDRTVADHDVALRVGRDHVEVVAVGEAPIYEVRSAPHLPLRGDVVRRPQARRVLWHVRDAVALDRHPGLDVERGEDLRVEIRVAEPDVPTGQDLADQLELEAAHPLLALVDLDSQ